eukprot:3686808-Prymnesium_polylepis.1
MPRAPHPPRARRAPIDAARPPGRAARGDRRRLHHAARLQPEHDERGRARALALLCRREPPARRGREQVYPRLDQSRLAAAAAPLAQRECKVGQDAPRGRAEHRRRAAGGEARLDEGRQSLARWGAGSAQMGRVESA